MPKLKVKKSALKRFRFTGTGKIKRSKAFKNHILTKKSSKRKNNLQKGGLVDSANKKQVMKLLTK